MSPSKLSRRTLFAGASSAGVVAALASMLPTAPSAVTAEVSPKPPAPANGGGYTLSDHVKQYYKTTRL